LREAELYRRVLHGTKPTATFAQAALAYLKRPTEDRPISTHTKMAIGRVAAHFGAAIMCDQIDQTAIDAAARALCSSDAKAATILRAVTTPTKAVLTYAARRGWCNLPAFESAKGGGKRTDWFTPAEAAATIDGAATHLKPLLAFLFCTGARVGEAVALEWPNVDLKYNRVTLLGEQDDDGRGGTKNGLDRIVDLPPRAIVALSKLTHRTGRVFLAPVGNPSAKTKRWEPYRLSGDNKFGSGGGQIKRSWATALKTAGITRHLTPHHARHTWATWAYCTHKDLIRLRQDGGWKTTSQCERYAKLAPDGMRAEIEAFWAGNHVTIKENLVKVA
jgi:integrase